MPKMSVEEDSKRAHVEAEGVTLTDGTKNDILIETPTQFFSLRELLQPFMHNAAGVKLSLRVELMPPASPKK
jgi:uncharacterized protein (DUF427 family)